MLTDERKIKIRIHLVGRFRANSKVLEAKHVSRKTFSGKLEDCPMWNIDGSSTEQASGDSSDCLLKPVAIFPDPDRLNGYLVMSEVPERRWYAARD